jgi:thiol-disulfide isomerase/thioredoxin
LKRISLLILAILIVALVNCSKKTEQKSLNTQLSAAQEHDCSSCTSECDSDLKISEGEIKETQIDAAEKHDCDGCASKCDSKKKHHVGEEIEWMTNIDEALKLAAETNKIVMVDFMAKWCPPCKQMDKVTFPNHKVVCKSEEFITVRIDVDEQQDVANEYNGNAGKYGGIGIPNMLFIDKGKNVKRHIVGFHEPAKLVSVMDSVLTEKFDN